MSERAVFSKMAWKLTPLPRWPRRPYWPARVSHRHVSTTGSVQMIQKNARRSVGTYYLFVEIMFSSSLLEIVKFGYLNSTTPVNTLLWVSELSSARWRGNWRLYQDGREGRSLLASAGESSSRVHNRKCTEYSKINALRSVGTFISSSRLCFHLRSNVYGEYCLKMRRRPPCLRRPTGRPEIVFLSVGEHSNGIKRDTATLSCRDMQDSS